MSPTSWQSLVGRSNKNTTVHSNCHRSMGGKAIGQSKRSTVKALTVRSLVSLSTFYRRMCTGQSPAKDWTVMNVSAMESPRAHGKRLSGVQGRDWPMGPWRTSRWHTRRIKSPHPFIEINFGLFEQLEHRDWQKYIRMLSSFLQKLLQERCQY